MGGREKAETGRVHESLHHKVTKDCPRLASPVKRAGPTKEEVKHLLQWVARPLRGVTGT